MSTGIYTKTAGDIMTDALRLASISGIQLDPDVSDMEVARTKLNDLLAWLQTKQIHLWSETEAFLPLNPNQKAYSFPGAHCFTDYISTATTANYIATNSTFLVSSTTGMLVGDFIGIELDDGTRWWDEILTVNSSVSVSTVTGITGASSSGATVYTYTTAIDQPVRILDGRYADQEARDEIQTTQLARKEYYAQNSKSSVGALNSWYYDRQLSLGKLNVWPVARNCKEVFRFTFIKPQYIPEDQSETILIPPEWFLPLTHKLAAELGVVYAIDPNKQVILEQKAENFIEDALGTDNEFSSFSFYPGEY